MRLEATIASGLLAGDGSKNPNKVSWLNGFTLTSEQRKDLIAFLQSLTDEEFVRDPRFADPGILGPTQLTGAVRGHGILHLLNEVSVCHDGLS